MALVGRYNHTTFSQSETETEEIIINNPDGTETKEIVPKTISNIEVIEQAYIIISHYMFYPIFMDDLGRSGFDFQYKVYQSKEDRDSNPNGWIIEGGVVGRFYDINSTDDIRRVAYEILKKEQGFEELIND